MAENQNTSTTNDREPSAEEKCCIICAGDGCEKIMKDDNFIRMLEFYFKSVKVDVKPEMAKGFFLCLPCFDSVIQFYQTNDLCVYFETKLEELQTGILRKQIKGVVAWQEKGLRLFPFQKDIMQEWGTKLESLINSEQSIKSILKRYEVTQYEEKKPEANPEKEGGQGQKSASSPTIVPAKDRGTETPQKRGITPEKKGPHSSKKRRGPPVTASRETDFHCEICLEDYQSSSELFKHARQHRGIMFAQKSEEKRYECVKCFRIFDGSAKIIEHKKTCRRSDMDVETETLD